MNSKILSHYSIVAALGGTIFGYGILIIPFFPDPDKGIFKDNPGLFLHSFRVGWYYNCYGLLTRVPQTKDVSPEDLQHLILH